MKIWFVVVSSMYFLPDPVKFGMKDEFVEEVFLESPEKDGERKDCGVGWGEW